MGTQAPAEIITREKVIEFLALIATGGKQSTLSREEGLEILLRIAGDRKIAIEDRLDAIKIHSTMLGYKLTESQVWSVITVLANGEHRESVDL
jgi:tRNA threonylcarbamoyladenosine modification (KEOPS) complex Cgi121 subunit